MSSNNSGNSHGSWIQPFPILPWPMVCTITLRPADILLGLPSPPHPSQTSCSQARVHLQKLSIICPSCSEWASVLHMAPVAKSVDPVGTIGSLIWLLFMTITPFPTYRTFLRNWPGHGRIFSKVDLIHGYHQVPVHPSHIHKNRHNHFLRFIGVPVDAIQSP